MSKLNYDNVARRFTISEGNMEIEYVITNESFEHEFGTQRQYGFEVMSVKYYIDEISEYVELGESDSLSKHVNKLIEKDL